MELNKVYTWELETSEGIVIPQYEADGTPNSWRKLPTGKPLSPELVVRISFIPQIRIFPRHDCLIDIANGEKFRRRFSRGFLKAGGKGMFEYLHVAVTNKYRMYVFSSNGSCKITPPSFEVYL